MCRGFTLLELSIVLILIALMLSGGLVTLNASLQASQFNATVKRMDTIEKALLDYSIANNRIPCPSDLLLAAGSANYGIEAANPGMCLGSTPTATFKTTSGTVEGGVPTRTLRLPDDYLYDGWGRRLRYAVDPTYTTNASLPVAAACSLSPTPNASAIRVIDAAGASRTTTGAYALISHGANGHGAYTRNGVTVNAASTNPKELINCHCDSTGATATVAGVQTINPATYVQMAPALDPASALNGFDDIVSFKDAWQLQTQNAQVTAANCGSEYLYVVDHGNHRVEKFDMNGNYLTQLGCPTGACSAGSANGQFDSPYRAAADSDGNIWVADNNGIQKFDKNSTYVTRFIPPSGGPAGMATDSTKNLWIGWGDVGKVDSGGAYTTAFWASDTVNGLALDAGGNIYVGEYNNGIIDKWSSSGSHLLSFGSSGAGDGQFYGPPDVNAVDSNGNIWVVDEYGNRVEKFNSAGVFQMQLGCASGACSVGSGNGEFHGPIGVALDSSGNIYVVELFNYRVQKFNSAGVYQSQFGSCCTADGQFNVPTGIVISNQ